MLGLGRVKISVWDGLRRVNARVGVGSTGCTVGKVKIRVGVGVAELKSGLGYTQVHTSDMVLVSDKVGSGRHTRHSSS